MGYVLLARRPRRAFGDVDLEFDAPELDVSSSTPLSADEASSLTDFWNASGGGQNLPDVRGDGLDAVINKATTSGQAYVRDFILHNPSVSGHGVPSAQLATAAKAAATAAGAGCAAIPVAGLAAAPLCSFLANQITLSVAPRPVPDYVGMAQKEKSAVLAAAASQCPPGDAACADKVRALLAAPYDRYMYLRGLDCSVQQRWCAFLGCAPEVPHGECDIDEGAEFWAGLEKATGQVNDVVIQARLAHEAAFLAKTKQRADDLTAEFSRPCTDDSCRRQVAARASDLAFAVALLERNGQAAQAKAALAKGRASLASLSASQYDAQLAKVNANATAADQLARAQRNTVASDQVAAVQSATFRRNAVVAVLAASVLAVTIGVYWPSISRAMS